MSMSDQKDDGTAVPVPRVLTTAQEHEAARKKAKQRHRSHYRDQAVAWATVIVLAALSYPLQLVYRHSYFGSCDIVSSLSAACAIHHAGLVLPSVVLFAILIRNGFYHHFSKQDWQVAIGNAQQTINPRNVTKGYTDLFNLYMRTKRRSYLLAGWGMLAFVYVIVGTIVNWGEVTPSLYWAQACEAALGVALFVFGYYMGSTYLPGDVIVRHQLALSIFAISDVTNVDDARLHAERDAEQFVRDNPWWFYPG
ncbi:MAG: hypothetical protein WCA78_02690 [Rhizomicrobium sp.]